MSKPSSANVTNEELRALGFPVEEFDTSMGVKVVRIAGAKRSVAVHAAWCAGAITMNAPKVPFGKTWAEAFGKGKVSPPVVDAAVLAFFGVTLSA
jgi:hypothetical protein